MKQCKTKKFFTRSQVKELGIAELQVVSANITAARAYLRISQTALAKRSGVSISVVRGIESGAVMDPHFQTLYALACALEMKFIELFEPSELFMPNDDELLRRAMAGDEEFVSAEALHAAIDERDGTILTKDT